MEIRLPEVIRQYIDASNRHEGKAILSCFTDGAVVHDEAEELRGKEAIEGWIVTTIEKYRFHFKPLRLKGADAGVVVEVEVSGTFDGSPITLDYHFEIAGEKISSLAIE